MNLHIAHVLELIILGFQIHSAIGDIDTSGVQTQALLPGANPLGNLVLKVP